MRITEKKKKNKRVPIIRIHPSQPHLLLLLLPLLRVTDCVIGTLQQQPRGGYERQQHQLRQQQQRLWLPSTTTQRTVTACAHLHLLLNWMRADEDNARPNTFYVLCTGNKQRLRSVHIFEVCLFKNLVLVQARAVGRERERPKSPDQNQKDFFLANLSPFEIGFVSCRSNIAGQEQTITLPSLEDNCL